MITIEIFAIIIVVLVQVSFFVRNLQEIRRIKTMFPVDKTQLSLKPQKIDHTKGRFKTDAKSIRSLDEITPGVAFHYSDQPEASYTLYDKKNEQEWVFTNHENEHQIIDLSELSESLHQGKIVIENGKADTASYTVHQIKGKNISPDFQQVLNDTNDYLTKNKGATADFNLLRDIAERWSGTLDNKIQTSIATPLYVGLVGTFLGVILGVLGMIDFGSGEEIVTDETINSFLIGVLIAMVGSGVGLLFTLIGNYYLKEARTENDTQKNQYYTWLQTHLLPNLHDDVSNSLSNLKTVLDSFNSLFFDKLYAFNELFGNLSSYINKQEEFLDRLDKIGYQRLINENLAIFNKIQESADKFDKFVDYQGSLNKALSEGKENVSQLTEIVAKLVKVEQLHKSITLNEDIISKQLSLLGAHDDKIKDISDAIAQHFDEANDDIAKVVQKRIELLQKEEQNAGEHLLKYFERLKEESPYQKITEEIGNALASLHQEVEKVTVMPTYRQEEALLEEVKNIGLMLHTVLNKEPWWKRMWSYIRRKFRKRR